MFKSYSLVVVSLSVVFAFADFYRPRQVAAQVVNGGGGLQGKCQVDIDENFFARKDSNSFSQEGRLGGGNDVSVNSNFNFSCTASTSDQSICKLCLETVWTRSANGAAPWSFVNALKIESPVKSCSSLNNPYSCVDSITTYADDNWTYRGQLGYATPDQNGNCPIDFAFYQVYGEVMFTNN